MYLYRKINNPRQQPITHVETLQELYDESGLKKVGYDQINSLSVYRSLRKLKHPELVVMELVETTDDRTFRTV